MQVLRSMVWAIIVIVAGSAAAAAQPAEDSVFVGSWSGELSVEEIGMSFRMAFDIAMDESGTLTATFASPDQGAYDIAVDSVLVEGDSLRMLLLAAAGEFNGSLREDGQALEGTWGQAGLSLPLVLERSESVMSSARPQDPEEPYPYVSEGVTIQSSAENVTLAGTLTLPESQPVAAGVVLISGSGPQNRDSEISNHRPFLVLADYLTRRGIAVLRYDDRGFGESTGSTHNATSEDFAKDANAARAFLSARPELEGAKVGLLGHSEGGIIAPMVATTTTGVDFLVLMAAPGVVGEIILMDQTVGQAEQGYETALDMALQMGPEVASQMEEAFETIIESTRTSQERIYSILKSEADSSRAAEEIRSVIMERFAQMGPPGMDIDAQVDAEVQQVNNAWMRHFLAYDPRPALTMVTVPVLAIGGSKDTQVKSSDNLSVIEAALNEAGNTDATVVELEGLNHMFQTAETGYVIEYGTIDETIAPGVLELIGDWILGLGSNE